MSPSLRAILEQHVTRPRFSVPQAVEAVRPGLLAGAAGASLRTLERETTPAEFEYLVRGLVRASFLIELVKQPAIETTKFEVRWADRLPSSDPRHASAADCAAIFERLADELAVANGTTGRRAVWKLFEQTPLLPYELPIDYVERRLRESMHRVGNVAWLWDQPQVHQAIQLRRAVTNSSVVGNEASVFSKTLDKIKVKTYLTDRVLTGSHKTNREKRWEAHPASVHFATRLQCLEIERELLEQLCFFHGFPRNVRDRLLADGLIRERADTTCPVTRAPLDYVKFVEEVRDPDHGKASFQVGHLNPLKAEPGEAASGHTAANIAWVSADGNRIQGSLSLKQTREMLRGIATRYGASGWREGDE